MRRNSHTGTAARGSIPLLCVALVASVALSVQAHAAPGADEPGAPTRSEVEAAADAAQAKERDVDTVRAELVLAEQRAQSADIKAAQAFEAWNGARWELKQARKAVASAEAAEVVAQTVLDDQEAAYSRIQAANYELTPQLASLGAVLNADGVEGVVDRTNTVYNATTAARDVKVAYEASVKVATLRTDEADAARQHAVDLEDEAASARHAAEEQQRVAQSEAAAVARRRDALIAELAELQKVSNRVAARRQEALESRARQAAAQAAEAASDKAARDAAEKATEEAKGNEDDKPKDSRPESATPATKPPQQPAPSNGSAVERMIAFAKAQLGDTYVWGAAGPDAWDCSGLVMAAWQKGGKSLPHYSVGQYYASTPVRAADLQPGDLVFWGTSNDPQSIHHVALYIGNGQIIHAPRTGRPVTQESIHYWVEPNFYARP